MGVRTTGRRKRAIAFVIAREANEEYPTQIMVNGMSLSDYFKDNAHCMRSVLHPLMLTGNLKKLAIQIRVRSGGVTGQAEAARFGVAKAVLILDKSTRPALL